MPQQQAYSAGLTDDQISSIISSRNADTYIRVFELLPQFLKTQDKDQVIRGFCEAVQQEIDRLQDSITDVITILDPAKVNTSYSLEGNFVFFHPEQFVYGCTFSNLPASIVFDGPVGGVKASGYYRDFGAYVWADQDTPSSVGQYRKILAYDGTTQVGLIDEDWEVVPSDNAVIALCWPDRVWLPVDIVSDPRKPGGTIFPFQNREDMTDYTGLAENLHVQLPGLSYLSTLDDYYKGWKIEFLDGEHYGRSIEIVRYIAWPRIIVLEHELGNAPNENDWFRLVPPGVNKLAHSDNGYAGKWLVVSPVGEEINYSRRLPSQARQIVRTQFNPLSTPASHVAWVYDPLQGDGKEFEYPPPPVAYYGITNSYVPLTYLASYVGIELDEEDSEDLQRIQISQAYSYHKLRGTRRALELVCKSFGLDVHIEELASNYTPAGGKVLTDGLGVPHVQYPNGSIEDLVLTGLGPDDIPDTYPVLPGMLAARIPDSDINVYLEKVGDSYVPFPKLLPRILKRLQFYLPAHVQIIVVGVLTRVKEYPEVEETSSIGGTLYVDVEDVETDDDLAAYLIGTAPVQSIYDLVVDDPLVIRSPARYSLGTGRYSSGGSLGATRWSVGSVRLA